MSARLVSIAMLVLLPALAEAQQVPVRCHDPLSEDQLTEMVKHSVPALPIQRNIAKCGIDFDATDEVIGRLRSAGAPETVLAAVRVATGPLDRKRQADQAFWDSVKNSQDPAKYEDYLRRYPAGQYAALARQKYRQLTAPRPSAQDLDEIAMRADAAFAQKDYATAAPLYRQLADSGRAAAMTILGWMYTIGQGETQDDAQAIAWYRKGAEGGNREAMTQLGFMYQNGRGVAQDDSQAVDWYRQAAEKGEPMGMTALGFMYENGRGVARDNSQAVDWYGRAAALGNEAAKANLKRLNEIAPAPKPAAQDLDEIARRADAAYTRQDYATAAPLFQQLADSGRPWDMYRLGYMYDYGQGFRQSDAQAVAWYRRAAEEDDPGGMNNLGVMYQNGRGVAQDYAQAVFWFRKAAEKGEPMGMTNLGVMYENGRGVARDNSLAVDWYRQAAALGDKDAEAGLKRLSRIAAPPKLSAKDLGKIAKRADAAYARQEYAKAAPLYQQLADSGQAGAMAELGFLYLSGRGVARDDAQAVAWLRKAAENGNATAMDNLGSMYSQGRGVSQDDAQAVDWYRKAAENDNPTGMTNLGLMYKNGRGVAQDDAQAVAWFRKAADKGGPTGMALLGGGYATGQGVAQDDAQAVAWIRKAAEKGEPTGMLFLGAMYEEGQGVAQDDTQAVAWYRKAAALGNEDAKERLKSMENPRRKKLTKKTTAVRVH